MRIALFATRREPSVLPKIEDIKDKLQKAGADVDATYFEDPLDSMRNDLEYTYNKVKKIIQKADLVVVEVTNLSTGMGLIIGRVIGYKKPILILFDKESKKVDDFPILAKAHASNKNKVFFKEYTKETLAKALEIFVSDSRKMLNTKYLFNLTPELAHYLQWASEKYNKPMVDILREQLQLQMNSDREWDKHISEE